MVAAISDQELARLWDHFMAIVTPSRPAPVRTSPHAWTPSRYWRTGVETSPGQEAYPGCVVCGRPYDDHP